MVADTDVLARIAIADYLRHCGYRVIEGGSADDVRTALVEFSVDVLLLDVTLGSSGQGFALAKEVRSQRPQTAVILTSSDANQAEKAGELCDEGPFVKPYSPHELERRIKLLKERQRQASER
jgi:DNA-binding response OmpR family regulator